MTVIELLCECKSDEFKGNDLSNSEPLETFSDISFVQKNEIRK